MFSKFPFYGLGVVAAGCVGTGRVTFIVGVPGWVMLYTWPLIYGRASTITTTRTKSTSTAPITTPDPALVALLSLISPGLFITVVM